MRAALAFVARGEAPLGIVYRTDAMAEARVRIVATFPQRSHAVISYPGAVVAGRNAAAASELLTYLASAPAQPVWQKHGFQVTGR